MGRLEDKRLYVKNVKGSSYMSATHLVQVRNSQLSAVREIVAGEDGVDTDRRIVSRVPLSTVSPAISGTAMSQVNASPDSRVIVSGITVHNEKYFMAGDVVSCDSLKRTGQRDT